MHPDQPIADSPGSAEPVQCPLCDYDLRGQIEPRCPECGYRFVWEELRDPRLRLHPYLFEHHPERNSWSFLRTLRGGMMPRRFWRGLLPIQPSRPRRLVLYYVIVALALMSGLVVQLAQLTADEITGNRAMRRNAAQSLATPQGINVLNTHPKFAGKTVQQVIDQELPLEPWWVHAWRA